MAEAVARREEREIAEAQASAQRQARSYSQSEMPPSLPRRPAAAPRRSDPYEAPVHPGFDTDRHHPVQRIELDARSRLRERTPLAHPARAAWRSARPTPSRAVDLRASAPTKLPASFPHSAPAPSGKPPVTLRTRATDSPADIRRTAAAYAGVERPLSSARRSGARPQLSRGAPPAAPDCRARTLSAARAGHAPAWLYSSATRETAARSFAVADTLQHSQERVASRWFALKGVFDPCSSELEVPRGSLPRPIKEVRPSALAVFSLAGGVGKTSLVATLGRALSALGEKVLLADTTSHGLMPFYFGASELRPGVVRTFSPPPGSTDAPIHLVSTRSTGTAWRARAAKPSSTNSCAAPAAPTASCSI